MLQLLGLPLDKLHERAEALALALRALGTLDSIEVAQDIAYVGGGSLPDQQLATWIVAVKPRGGSDVDLARRLRLGTPAVLDGCATANCCWMCGRCSPINSRRWWARWQRPVRDGAAWRSRASDVFPLVD